MLFLVPTRNRAELAIRNIQSLLRAEQSERIQILVSDNSTDEEAMEQLASFCATCPARVTYVRPERPLAMTPHWNWMLCYALDHFDVSDIGLMSDRMIMKADGLAALFSARRRFPDRVLSYHNHTIHGHGPVTLSRPWETGQAERVSCELLLQKISQASFHIRLPRMLNCIVPRRLFETMRTDELILDSIAPDFFFCFYCLHLEAEIVFLRQAIVVHYALERSNGHSFARGEMTKDHKDFMRSNKLDTGPRAEHGAFWATPEPRLMTIGNAILNEYLVVNERVGGGFPPLSLSAYWRRAAVEVARIQNPEVRTRMESLLAEHGVTPLQALQMRGLHFLLKLQEEPEKLYEMLSTRVLPQSRFETLEEALQVAQSERSIGRVRRWLFSSN